LAQSWASAEYWIHFTARFGGVHALVITPPKVNQCGLNLEHSEYIVGGWPWQILGAIHAVATAGEPGEIFLSGKQCTISLISCRPNFTKFEHNTSINVAMKTSITEF